MLDEDTGAGPLRATPLLTVWRRLNVEVDSMGAPAGDANIVYGNDDPPVPAGGVARPDTGGLADAFAPAFIEVNIIQDAAVSESNLEFATYVGADGLKHPGFKSQQDLNDYGALHRQTKESQYYWSAYVCGIYEFGSITATVAGRTYDMRSYDNDGNEEIAATGLTLEDPDKIENMITDTGGGTYTVTLYDPETGRPRAYPVTADLDRGFNMAALSGDMSAGDFETGDVDPPGYAEIWPMLLEKAYAELLGGYDKLGAGGDAATAYTALTGIASPPVVLGGDSGVIAQQIKNALAQGDQVVLGTPNDWPGGDTPSLRHGTAHANHAYVVTGFNVVNGTTLFDLHNPWGTENIQVSEDELNLVVASIKVLKSLN